MDLVIPLSIDWAQAPWAEELLEPGVPVFSPTGEGMKIERERDFARKLCQSSRCRFRRAHVARNRLEAEEILARHPRPFVIKNPLCSPTSPIHTILCETVEDTRAWLRQVNYAEGVFLQEYLGRGEAGHIALVSGGEIYSLVTNQEYKRAFAGNMGVVAGAPLGGLVEKDPDDKYGLARELLHPLLPWFREVDYHGPIQVTAVHREGKWHVIEYNIRIGVTSGAMILRLLRNPLETLLATARNEKLEPQFRDGVEFRLLGHAGGLRLSVYAGAQGRSCRWKWPASLTATSGGTKWRATGGGRLMTTGHRIADVIGSAPTLEGARGEGLREHPQNPQAVQLLSLGHWPEPLAAGLRIKRGSRRQPLDLPGAGGLARVTEAVVQPVGAALPEFDGVGSDDVTAPDRRAGNRASGKFLLDYRPVPFPGRRAGPRPGSAGGPGPSTGWLHGVSESRLPIPPAAVCWRCRGW